MITIDEAKAHEIEVAKFQLMRDSLLLTAYSAITPLQYAADLDDATDEESALLKEWKQYVVAINRLDLSAAPDIIWPETPR